MTPDRIILIVVGLVFLLAVAFIVKRRMKAEASASEMPSIVRIPDKRDAKS